MVLTSLAGIPAITLFFGKDLFTTEFAPKIEFLPIVTGPIILAHRKRKRPP